MIRYVTGDATEPIGDGPKLLCHICNDRGGWGKGFVLAVSRRWPDVREYYKRWVAQASASGTSLLGQVQFLDVGYDALRACLERVYFWAGAPSRLSRSAPRLHMPRIGTGLAGGHWDNIEPMIERELATLHVTVYDLPKQRRSL